MIKLNKKEVLFGRFPNNELYLEKENLITNSYNRIYWEWEDNDDFIKLWLLKSYLDAIFTTSDLHIFYMPYSRMDRSNQTYIFSLKYITNFINSLNFFAVRIREPHSDVTPALFNKCIVEKWCEFKIKKLISTYDIDSLFYPDAGAQKRYHFDYPSAVGNKIRNFKTGEIISFTCTGTIGNNVLIVDDLCSRGGTFIEASKKLKQLGANKIYLLVSYLEKNVLNGDLDKHIERVFAGNKFYFVTFIKSVTESNIQKIQKKFIVHGHLVVIHTINLLILSLPLVFNISSKDF